MDKPTFRNANFEFHFGKCIYRVMWEQKDTGIHDVSIFENEQYKVTYTSGNRICVKNSIEFLEKYTSNNGK